MRNIYESTKKGMIGHRIEFGLLLGRRGIPRHYTEQDLEDDIA